VFCIIIVIVIIVLKYVYLFSLALCLDEVLDAYNHMYEYSCTSFEN